MPNEPKSEPKSEPKPAQAPTQTSAPQQAQTPPAQTPAQPQAAQQPPSSTPQTPAQTQAQPAQPQQADKPKKRGCCSCLNCFLVCVVVFVLFIFGTASVMAASGLYNIPLLSKWLYKEPTAREVKSLTQQDLLNKVQAAGALTKGQKKSEVTLEFTQDELAGYIIGMSQGTGTVGNTSLSTIEKINFNIEPQKVDTIFLVQNPFSILPLARDKIWLTADFFAQVQNQNLSLRIDKIKVGGLSIPLGLADSLFHYSSQLKSIPVSGLNTLELKQGSFKVTVEPGAFEEGVK